MREQKVSLHRGCSYGSRDKYRFHCALVLDHPEVNQIVRFLKGTRRCDNISVVVQPVAPPCPLRVKPGNAAKEFMVSAFAPIGDIPRQRRRPPEIERRPDDR